MKGKPIPVVMHPIDILSFFEREKMFNEIK